MNSLLTVLTLSRPGITDFAAARNELLSGVKSPWVMYVDSDEVVSPSLRAEVKRAVASGKYDAYTVLRREEFLGRLLEKGESGQRYLRLAKRDFGRWHRPVHEVWQGKGRVGKLHSPLIHRAPASLAEFVAKLDRYSTIESRYRFSLGKRAALWRVWFNPLAKFAYLYLFRLGFLDGVPGLIHAVLMSWHSYLTWSKLYLLCRSV